MILLRRNTSKPGGLPPTPPSFQMHLKLNTHEFLIRLVKLRQLTIERSLASTLIQVLDPSYKLIRQIAKAEKHMRVMRRNIRDDEDDIVGERRYFGECILLTEAVVGDLRTLLYSFHEAYRPGAQVPAEFLGRGEAVSNRLDELCDGFVAVRRALAQEAKMRAVEEKKKKKKKKEEEWEEKGGITMSLLSEMSLSMTTARAKAMTKEATMMTIVVVQQQGAYGLVFQASRFPAAIQSVVVAASAVEPDDDGQEEEEEEKGEGEGEGEGLGGKDQGAPPPAVASSPSSSSSTNTEATATSATATAIVVAKATTATPAPTITAVTGTTTTIPSHQRKSYWDANGRWYCDCCRYLL